MFTPASASSSALSANGICLTAAALLVGHHEGVPARRPLDRGGQPARAAGVETFGAKSTAPTVSPARSRRSMYPGSVVPSKLETSSEPSCSRSGDGRAAASLRLVVLPAAAPGHGERRTSASRSGRR